ncbi:MAG: DUF4880 domain-containing protein [Paracoccus denitrificans]|uniref:DUF4880 domain-containing protein n=1 Tax=Paracoccus denitrificans TaxID=266 RepID=A0A533I3D7_PARDE|nr:MAG: DUF4880 domain-containing protein [Paracoccus denitrificans]
MDETDDKQGDAALRREAHQFVARLRSGEATAEDADALRRWRGQSHAHEMAFRDAAILWNSLGSAVGPVQESTRSLSRRKFIAGASLAASVGGLAFVGSSLGYLPTMSAMAADYATGVAEQKSFDLDDGTSVLLDAGSALDVDITSSGGTATLHRGAGVFTVSRPALPFDLAAASGRIMADQGVFSVSKRVNSVEVACIEGRVDVACNGTRRLIAGEMARYDDMGISEPIRSDPDAVAAWRKRLLVFSDRPLGEVVSDLNRHRTGRVILARKELENRRVSGVFHLSRPDEIISHLATALALNVTSLPGRVVILR